MEKSDETRLSLIERELLQIVSDLGLVSKTVDGHTEWIVNHDKETIVNQNDLMTSIKNVELKVDKITEKGQGRLSTFDRIIQLTPAVIGVIIFVVWLVGVISGKPIVTP